MLVDGTCDVVDRGGHRCRVLVAPPCSQWTTWWTSHQAAGISHPGHWQCGLRAVIARRMARGSTRWWRGPTFEDLAAVVGRDRHDGGVAEDPVPFAGVDHPGEQAERQRWVVSSVGACVGQVATRRVGRLRRRSRGRARPRTSARGLRPGAAARIVPSFAAGGRVNFSSASRIGLPAGFVDVEPADAPVADERDRELVRRCRLRTVRPRARLEVLRQDLQRLVITAPGAVEELGLHRRRARRRQFATRASAINSTAVVVIVPSRHACTGLGQQLAQLGEAHDPPELGAGLAGLPGEPADRVDVPVLDADPAPDRGQHPAPRTPRLPGRV